MLAELKHKIPQTWYPYLLPPYQRVRKRIEQLDRVLDKRTLSQAKFIEALTKLGFTPGATVYVYSAFSKIKRRVLNISPENLIRILQELVGPEGTLLMPTYSFRGSQAEYADAHTHFDVQKTPSQVGVLTEVFRTTPGVVRSLHPTHSVAAWGRHAQDLISTHHLGSTFGATSPLYKLRDYNGLVIGLGARYRYGFGPTHVPEEINTKARELAFEERPRRMILIDGSREIPYEFRVFRRGVSREYERIEKIMLREKILRYFTVGGLELTVGNADAFIARGLELAEENNYILRER